MLNLLGDQSEEIFLLGIQNKNSFVCFQSARGGANWS